jgi:regulator of protease activity HflC (stomatin/prohibitin superfamily)
MNSTSMILINVLIVPVLAALLYWIHHLVMVQVEENHAVVLTRFGKFEQLLDQPGEYFIPTKVFPWVKLIPVSKQMRSLTLDPIAIHDRNGTSLLVAIFMEYTMVDPVKVVFSVEDWKASVQSICLHATTSVLSGLQFEEVLKNRSVLEQKIRAEIESDFKRWGIELHHFLIQNLSLLLEVSRQVLQGVAAHLEKKKALIEEYARMESLKIDADTSHEVAELKGEAQSQMALAIGRAMESMKSNPKVFDAYQQLYSLSLNRPEQTVFFEGFEHTMGAADAAFMMNAQWANEKAPSLKG